MTLIYLLQQFGYAEWMLDHLFFLVLVLFCFWRRKFHLTCVLLYIIFWMGPPYIVAHNNNNWPFVFAIPTNCSRTTYCGSPFILAQNIILQIVKQWSKFMRSLKRLCSLDAENEGSKKNSFTIKWCNSFYRFINTFSRMK